MIMHSANNHCCKIQAAMQLTAKQRLNMLRESRKENWPLARINHEHVAIQ
jgi:hypothetical protein